jgi:hypothetical protein
LPDLTHLLPNDVRLATVAKYSADTFQLTGVAPRPETNPAPVIHYHLMTLDDIIAHMPEADQWAIDTFHSADEGFILADGIIKGVATAVSDGSYKNHIGTSGFILRGANRQIGAIGDNVVPGNPHEQSSYRSELAGISGVLALVSAVCKKYDITDGSILLALDGEQALLKASSTWPLSPQDTDFDLLCDIRRKILKLPVTIKWQWIEGHQDDHVSFSKLSGLAQDNVSADSIAKLLLNSCGEAGYQPTSQRFGDEGWSLFAQGVKVSKLDYRRLYTAMWATKGLDYWTTKHDIPFVATLSIDWDACGDAIRTLSFARRRRMIKHASGHFGVGSALQIWGVQDNSHCPRCQSHESPVHVLLCPDPRAITVWETSLTKLDSWMLKKKTDPELRCAILSRLREWHRGTAISTPDWDSSFKAALRAQNSIGWYPFLLGHVANQWHAVQQAYYTSLCLDNTGRQWVRQLILQLFNISWDMWEHRNGIKYKTVTPAKTRELRMLNDRVKMEFDLGPRQLLPRDKRWFTHSLHTLTTTYTTVQKAQWLASVANARLRWTRRQDLQRASIDASRRLLRNWLVPPAATSTT